MEPSTPLRNNRIIRYPKALVVGLVGATLLMAGCGSSSSKPGQSVSPTVSDTPSPNPTAQAQQQVLSSYQKMWTATEKVYASGSYQGVNLNLYLQDKALENVKLTEAYLQQNGIVIPGQPKLAPTVTAINLGAQPPTATIKDCVDSTNFVGVYKVTNKPVQTADNNRRHVNTFTAQKYGDQWYFTNSVIDRTGTC